MSTTTAVQLEAFGNGTLEPHASTLRPRAGLADNTSFHQNEDPALEESRIADSTVPDGGYGWVVIIACAVVAWWVIGLSYVWGVYQSALVERNVGSPLALSFCGSLSPALMATVGMLVSRMLRSFGTRKLSFVGIILMALSLIGASFVTDHLVGLVFLPGVPLGLGMSGCFMSFSVVPAQYFKRKRGLANGIVYAGGGFGGAIMSIATNSLIEKYSVEWAFRITGLLIAATGLPAAMLIKERTPLTTTGIVDWKLFFPLLVPPYFLPLYSRSMGLSTGTGAGLLAGFSFSSAVGRIMSGYLCDILGPVNTLGVFFLGNSLTMLALWPASTTLAPLAVFAVLNGLMNGGFFSSMPTVVGNVFGSARVSTAMGMMIAGWVAGYLFVSYTPTTLLERQNRLTF
jgi:MFS family permease